MDSGYWLVTQTLDISPWILVNQHKQLLLLFKGDKFLYCASTWFYSWGTDTGLYLALVGAGRNAVSISHVRNFTDSFFRKAEISHLHAAGTSHSLLEMDKLSCNRDSITGLLWPSLCLFVLFISLSYVTIPLNSRILQQQPQFFIILLD